MLDIISMITLLFLIIGLPLILIIIGGSNKTKEEQELEDEEQIKYLKEYKEKRLNKWKNGGCRNGKRILYMESSKSL